MLFHSSHTAIWWFYTQTIPFALASVCNTEERKSQQGLQIWFSLETGATLVAKCLHLARASLVRYSPWSRDGDRYDLATKHMFENHVSTPTHPSRGPSLTMHPRNQGKRFFLEKL